jgi:hypothetical protein
MARLKLTNITLVDGFHLTVAELLRRDKREQFFAKAIEPRIADV